MTDIHTFDGPDTRTLEQIVGEAIGHASMCWTPTPTGEFDSVQATAVVDELLQEIRALNAPTQPYLGLATTAQLIDELRARAEVGGYATYRTVD